MPLLPPPPPPPPPPPFITVYPQNLCESPAFEAPGYSEGVGVSQTRFTKVVSAKGLETVYDFATMERATFEFEQAQPHSGSSSPGWSTSLFEAQSVQYSLHLEHFDNLKSLRAEYEGLSTSFNFGAGVGPGRGPAGVSAGVGYAHVTSPEVSGNGTYIAVAASVSLVPIFSYSSLDANYTRIYGTQRQYVSPSGNVTWDQVQEMKNDIITGGWSWRNIPPVIARSIAAKKLEDVWRAHENYFLFEFKNYQPREN